MNADEIARRFGPPMDVIDLFEPLRAELLALLESLAEAQWRASTICDPWDVKDLSAHLLADDLGVVSRGQYRWPDGHFAGDSWSDLLAFIDRQNETWVEAMRRLAPQQVIAMLRESHRGYISYMRSRDLAGMGGAVDWAGPGPAPVWLGVAREYKEHWMHQAQIREAVGAPMLYEPRSFAPVLDAFARALRHTYRQTAAPAGARVTLRVDGDAGGVWSILRQGDTWSFDADVGAPASATVTLPQDRAWRLFTRGIAPAEAGARIEGDQALGDVALGMVSLLA